MGMQPRQVSSASMGFRVKVSASIAFRLLAIAQMASRSAIPTIISHFQFNQQGQPYQSPITYNYSTSNGQMQTRTVASPAMKGR